MMFLRAVAFTKIFETFISAIQGADINGTHN